MSPALTVPAKLIAFAALLGLAFGGAALAGAAIDPTDPEETTASHAGSEEGHGGSDEGAASRGAGGPVAGGLAVSQGGYTLEPARTVLAKGRPARFSFRITGAGGRAVRDGFELEQERELHLIVVRLAGEGRKAGREGRLSFAVTRGGEPVRSLEDYLGAKGHLVALREGDLAYLHVHPTGAGGHSATGAEPRPDEVAFAATFPTAGRYRLFFQFKIDGQVRTVAYTTEVPR